MLNFNCIIGGISMIKLLAQPYYEDDIGFVSQNQLQFIENQLNSELYLLAKNFDIVDKSELNDVIKEYMVFFNEDSYAAQAMDLFNLILDKTKNHKEAEILMFIKKELKLPTYLDLIDEDEILKLCFAKIFDITDLEETLSRLDLETERLELIASDEENEFSSLAEQRLSDLIENDIFELEQYLEKFKTVNEEDFSFIYMAKYLDGKKINDNLEIEEDPEIILDIDFDTKSYEVNFILLLRNYILNFISNYMKSKDNDYTNVINTLMNTISQTDAWNKANQDTRQEIISIVKLYATSEHMNSLIELEPKMSSTRSA